jgi:hypothetical protein
MICSYCNKEFIKTNKGQKYCTKECSKEKRIEKANKWKKSDKGKESKKKYNSSDKAKALGRKREEQRKLNRTDIRVNCQNCNKEFTKTKNGQKYCTKECTKEFKKRVQLRKYQKKHINADLRANCQNCNKEFTPRDNRQKNCSKECTKKSKNELSLKRHFENYEDIKEQKKEYYSKNKEHIKEAHKKYYLNNKEVRNEYTKKYSQSAKGKETINKGRRKRIKSDPIFKLAKNVRTRLGMFIKTRNIRKTNKTFVMVGCTPEFLKKHLEKQFYNRKITNEPMTWKNHSLRGWHVDHIKSIDKAKTSEDLEKLSHYTNLQPLWSEDNWEKSNKII